jgi:hypothetical protein
VAEGFEETAGEAETIGGKGMISDIMANLDKVTDILQAREGTAHELVDSGDEEEE